MAYDDRELEEIRQRKILEMRRQLEEEQRKKELEAQLEAQRQALLRSILTEKARERLANLRLVKPELARATEEVILNLVNAGRLPTPVSDEQVKAILLHLDQKTRRDFKIRIKRK